MAQLVTGAELVAAVESGSFIKGGILSSAEGIKYDFRLGTRILKAAFRRPVDVKDLSETEKSHLLVIDPGEMVFVLSEEHLDLPSNMVAQLSPKRKLSHDGILVLGGFSIDPLYQGRLLVGLYNFSSTPYALMPGRKLIAATFFSLDSAEQGDFPRPDSIEDFPEELVKVMQHYQPVAIAAVKGDLGTLRSDLEALRREILSRDEWYQQLKNVLDAHQKDLDKLLLGLSSEIAAREKGEGSLSAVVAATNNRLESIDKTLESFKTAGKVVGFILTVLLIPIVLAVIFKFFDLN